MRFLAASPARRPAISTSVLATRPMFLPLPPRPHPQVMHDCRSDCEALFYQHGIRAAGLWDTQVGGERGALVACR